MMFGTPDHVRHAFRWTHPDWCFSTCAAYAVTGQALRLLAYRRGLPLTILS